MISRLRLILKKYPAISAKILLDELFQHQQTIRQSDFSGSGFKRSAARQRFVFSRTNPNAVG